MQGFRGPVYTNFVPDRTRWSASYGDTQWQCRVCGKPKITDRTQHNMGGCAPVAWLDPLGVLVETVFALWGPDAPTSVVRIIPEIPAGKHIKVSELPYFTKDPNTDKWMVVGEEEFMEPGYTVAVNRRGEDKQEVTIDEWRYRSVSPRSGKAYVIATFKRSWEI